METVELSSIDLRLEHMRQRDRAAERRLLISMMERGLLDPLQVAPADAAQTVVLVDGFKRYRCARKMGMSIVAVERIGQSVADGLLRLLRRDKTGGLSMLEQAAIVEELYSSHKLSIYEIAGRLGHCVSWVSMRLGLGESMSELVREKIMSGAFPARAYLYGLKGFTRVNKIAQERVDDFVEAVSGKGLSTRELFVLSRAYFGGGCVVQQLITDGHPRRALQLLSGQTAQRIDSTLSDSQRTLLRDLECAAVSMERVEYYAGNVGWESEEFSQIVNLSSERIRRRLRSFAEVIRGLYDRSEPARCREHATRAGSQSQTHCAAVAHGCEDRSCDPGGQ